MKPESLHVALITRDRPGAWSRSVLRGFEQNGVRCTLVPYENRYPNIHRAGLRGSGVLNQLLRASLRPAVELWLLDELRRLKPDIIFFLKSDDLHRFVYRAVRRIGRPILVAYHPDDPFNTGRLLPGVTGPSHPRALLQARAMDLNVTWSPAIKTRLATAGCKDVLYLPFATDPELHQPTLLSDDDRTIYGADISFVGNWDAERERWLAELAPLCELKGLSLAIWGSRFWASHCHTAAVTRAWRGRELAATEMAKVAAASVVNLNILRRQNIGASNMRTFEIPSAGGFLLHQRSPVLADYLPPGRCCDDFATAPEIVEKTRFYKDNPVAWEAIRMAGFEAARRWTYREWTGSILARLRGNLVSPND